MVDPNETITLHCDLWMDLADPWSYLALNGIRKAIARLPFAKTVEVNIRPHFTANVSKNFGDHQKLEERAAQEGIVLESDPFEEDVRPAPGRPKWAAMLPAQQLVAFARELDEGSGVTGGANTLQLRLAEGLLRTAFEMGGDIRNPEVVIAVGQDYGIPGEQSLGAIEDAGLEDDVLAQFELGSHLGFESYPVVNINDGLQVPGDYTVDQFDKALSSAHAFYMRGERSEGAGENK